MKKIQPLLLFIFLAVASFGQRVSLEFSNRPQTAYLGVDNQITCTVEGISCKNVHVSTVNGSMEKIGGCMYNFRPAYVSNSKIIISKKVKDSLVKITEVVILVRNIPPPVASVGGFEGGPISKKQLNVQQGIGAYTDYNSLGFDLTYSVRSFIITAIRNKELLFFKAVEGNMFTPEVLQLFDTLQNGDIITFSVIKVLMPGGKEGLANTIEFTIE